MEQEWIDRLAQIVTRNLGRRNVLASLAGVVGLAALGTGDEPAAAKKRKKRKKRKNAPVPPAPQPCSNGEVRCGSACVNTNQDAANCGACGVRCQDGETCCAGRCRTTQTDAEHCGACGESCAPGHICVNSSCGTACGNGICLPESNAPTCCDETCTDVQHDPQHCGQCDVACQAAEQCCGGICADTANDRDHCGACGAACGQRDVCQDSVCATPCGAAGICRADSQKPVCCDESCVNLDRDPHHCGACGHACAETERCWNGVCVCGDVCHNGCQFSDIQAAINAAEAEDTVRVCAGTYNGAIAIDKKLTLVGAGNTNQGTFIQGRHGASTVTVNRGGAELRGFTITGGSALQSGGGVNTAADLTMVDCTVSHNAAVMSGGGIWNLGFGQLVLRRCTIEHNTAGQQGGGIDNSSRLEMTDCVVQNNDAPRGGGLYNFWVRQANLTGSVLRNNTASDRGGGVFNGGALTLTGCSVIGNEAGADGGGIFNDPERNGTVLGDEATVIMDNLPNDCANTDACSA